MLFIFALVFSRTLFLAPQHSSGYTCICLSPKKSSSVWEWRVVWEENDMQVCMFKYKVHNGRCGTQAYPDWHVRQIVLSGCACTIGVPSLHPENTKTLDTCIGYLCNHTPIPRLIPNNAISNIKFFSQRSYSLMQAKSFFFFRRSYCSSVLGPHRYTIGAKYSAQA